MFGPRRIEKAVEQGERVFWEEMQKLFPEMKPEDVDPGMVMALAIHMKTALERTLVNTTERIEDEAEGPSPALYILKK